MLSSCSDNNYKVNEWMSFNNHLKKIVWSTRIGRIVPIWILYLILGSGLRDESFAVGNHEEWGGETYGRSTGDLRSFYM
jgi:hypothetical protein